jgi:hypothetical protein
MDVVAVQISKDSALKRRTKKRTAHRQLSYHGGDGPVKHPPD